MTKDREIPKHWPIERSSEAGNHPRAANPFSSSSRSAGGAGGAGRDRDSRRDRSPKNRRDRDSETPHRAASSPRTSQGEQMGTRVLKWLTSWQLWGLFTLVLCGSLGGGALMMLLKLPAVPNCNNNQWGMISASEHMYCAQKAASEQTVEGLLEAISQVNQLPQDHPLRPELNRQIQKWAEQLLDLAEHTFQEGKLTEAIATARQVPSNTEAAQLVEERIERWQSIWNEAQEIYKKAESELEKENWGQAIRLMRQLTVVGNTYWETTKYDALNQSIEATRKEGQTLDEARNLAEKGELKDILEAIKVVEEIEPSSKLYKKSRSLVAEFAKQILDLARERVEEKDWQDAIYIARQVPYNSSVKKEADDLIDLVRARSIAARATVRSLSDAIAKARLIGPTRPLYGEAQQLIAQWQDSIKDVAYLEEAQQLAQGGTMRDLKAAIAQAQQVERNNPVWEKAQSEIDGWRSRIESTEDRPYLRQAEQLARYGDRPSLEAAINAARNIAPGRALYQEAQAKIQDWQLEIQRLEDRPILDRAWSLSQLGNVKAAISMAQTIPPNRALYDEAQSAIQGWQQEIRDRETLDEAYRIGDLAQTPQELLRAIEIANRVSSGSSLRFSADAAIDDWSQRILSLAQDQSTYNLEAAVNIAKIIPYYSSVYPRARREVEAWEILLNPPPPPLAEPDTARTNRNTSPSFASDSQTRIPADASSQPQTEAIDDASPASDSPNGPEEGVNTDRG
ncbi:hypothetical protein [Phormidium sp. CCY1219]|uniref:hypothetical protein n=1 Tax=Phormidium sp. CCY1219 TaxID=2886104 RepID=UPI002D1EC6DC|nr:hypothetical protein [Phormidium sp. CCY1219]MEB3830444.1 hypothetical protein [Phormidium sp. CCY1219]